MFLIFSSSVAIILYVICCGFLRFFLLACVMLVGLMAIFDFVAEQTANDDCAKVQLVRKKTSSAFVKTAALQQVVTC